MKKMYFMLLLALAGLGSSCTNEDDSQGQTTLGTAGEIQLLFSGSGDSEEYTKAIASEPESKIGTLKVYLFASAAANATDANWHYLETWTKTDAAPGAGSKDFNLQSSGSSWKAFIKPGELKGLPYLTLVCVANQDDVPDETGAAITLTPVTTSAATGDVENAGTLLSDFKKAYTAKLTGASTSLTTPLVMTGTGTTKISGSVSKVTINLKRIVARFDIDNTTATSNLTIEKIAFGDGRPNGSLFGGELTEIADVDRTDKLLTYKDRDFLGENANLGTLESALYVYPTHKTDKSFLIIKGKYKSPSTGQGVDVTYNIPIVKTPEDADPADAANYIPVVSNSRYKLHITDVTESNIFASFEVEDWTSGGGVIIKPDNAKPEIKEITADADAPTEIVKGVSYRTVDAGTFKITLTSTGKLECSKGLATKAGDTDVDWLTVGNVTEEQKDGLTVTTYEVTTAALDPVAPKHPVSLTFINQAASYDPDLQTTLTFFGPELAPVVSEVVKGNSKGNTVDFSDQSALKAVMIKEVGSYVSLDVFSPDGLAAVTVPTGYSVDTVSTKGFTTTYRIAIKDAATAANNETVEFKNKAKESEVATLTIEHKTASKPQIVVNDNGSYTNSSYNTISTIGGTATAATSAMYMINGSTMYVKVTCTESSEAEAIIADATGSNLTVTEETAVPGIFKIEIADATTLTAETPVTVTFKNKAEETVTSTLTITPKSTEPTVELSNNVGGVVEEGSDGTYTVDYDSLNDSFTLTVTAPTGATAKNWAAEKVVDGCVKLNTGSAGDDTLEAGVAEVYTFEKGSTADTPFTLTLDNAVTDGKGITITITKK